MRSLLPLALFGALAATPVLAQQQPATAPGGIGLEQSQIEPMADVVMRVEQRLDQLGYNVNPDGRFDADLRNSVLLFQSENGLRPTGNVDLSTLAALGIDVSPGGAVASTSRAPETAFIVVDEEPQQTALLEDDGVDFPLLRDEHMSSPHRSIQSAFPFENYTGVPQPDPLLMQQARDGEVAGIPPGFPVEDIVEYD